MKKIKNHKGLGDTVEAITESIGLKKVIDEFFDKRNSEGCGCQKRKENLNKWFPYKK